ncbi:MAG: ATP-binding protein, partial [Burkholderiales bacterium]
ALPGGSAAALAPEFARRFRYEGAAIGRIGAELAALGRDPSLDEMLTLARADLDLGTLAQPVVPRFGLDELMLPAAQAGQIQELVCAMTNLTRVHYEWGAARAWGECGLAALFAGPPGTGKTMAAEALARTLGLPLYRIDLSQVVNKYIGETEKNLRRLFDAADAADLILFFDEADALFGKRTEVRDAHDRYANIEVSYLLERMERFKGLAILATNRKKDLDEAFLRRLRFVVEFPLPGVEERLRIWRSVIPDHVDATDVDFGFLAQRFALAGGHIRAIVFQACLQSAFEGAPRRLTMPALVRAVQREYDKLERANSLDQFGPYAALVASHRTPR